MGPGTGRAPASRRSTEGIPGAEKHVIRGVEPLDDLRQHGGARSGRDRLLLAAPWRERPRRAGDAGTSSCRRSRSYGVEPIPAELRTVGWRDLFAINFTFFLNPVMYVLGALAVVDGGLPLRWAVAATVLGQALAFGLLVVVAQPGVDYGLPGQVAMRASLGVWGARGLSSPYRMIAATYWFAAQALAGALGIQAIVVALGGGKPPLVPVALALAVFHATLAVLGFDVMRYVLRVVLPLSLVSRPCSSRSTSPPTTRATRSAASSTRPTSSSPGRASRRTSPSCAAPRSRSSRTSPTFAATRRRGETCRIGLLASAVLAVARHDLRRRLRGRGNRRAQPLHRRRRPHAMSTRCSCCCWRRSSSRASPPTSRTCTPQASRS